MNEINLETVNDLFDEYGHLLEINYDIETIPIGGFGASYSAVYGRSEITAKIRFRGKESVRRLYDDLRKLKDVREEEAARLKSPAVHKAWEEYQLLLKLSK
jgi:hypothetical protein